MNIYTLSIQQFRSLNRISSRRRAVDNTRRISFGDNAGSDDEMGYLVIVNRDDDGSMTGMVFRTPKRMG